MPPAPLHYVRGTSCGTDKPLLCPMLGKRPDRLRSIVGTASEEPAACLLHYPAV